MLNTTRGWSFLLVLDIIVGALLVAVMTTFHDPIFQILNGVAGMFMLTVGGSCQ